MVLYMDVYGMLYNIKMKMIETRLSVENLLTEK